MSSSRTFDNQNRVKLDDCAITAREYQNSSVNDYALWNTYFMDCNPEGEAQLEDFSTKNVNLHFRNGVGFTNACYVDNDTDLRVNGVWTNEKAKTQLFTRFYQANPNLARGVPEPDVEMPLVQGEESATTSFRFNVVEKDYDRFVPLVPQMKAAVQDPDNIVLPFHQSGEDSREYMRTKQRELAALRR